MFKKSREKKLLTNKQMEYFELCSFREEEISRCSYFVDKFYCIARERKKKNGNKRKTYDNFVRFQDPFYDTLIIKLSIIIIAKKRVITKHGKIKI